MQCLKNTLKHFVLNAADLSLYGIQSTQFHAWLGYLRQLEIEV